MSRKTWEKEVLILINEMTFRLCCVHGCFARYREGFDDLDLGSRIVTCNISSPLCAEISENLSEEERSLKEKKSVLREGKVSSLGVATVITVRLFIDKKFAYVENRPVLTCGGNFGTGDLFSK